MEYYKLIEKAEQDAYETSQRIQLRQDLDRIRSKRAEKMTCSCGTRMRIKKIHVNPGGNKSSNVYLYCDCGNTKLLTEEY